MSCENSPEISFSFEDNQGNTVLQIRPRSMQFDRNRNEFDYCTAEFSNEVAEHISPHLDEESDFLRRPLPVVLHIEGEPVYRLLWVPDGVRFTENEVHVDLHDPQKFLTRGVVDWKQNNVKLREAYEYVFAQRDTSGPQIFNDIKFTIPDESYTELRTRYRKSVFGYEFWSDSETEEILDEERAESPNYIESDDHSETIKRLEEENVINIIDGHYAIDFEKITPWEAITKLNEKFGVTTWAAPDGNLWVGARATTGVAHLAAPDDDRVWKLQNFNVSPPRDPIVKYTIEGPWKTDPADTPDEYLSDFADLNTGTKDFRLHGVATRRDILFGQEGFEQIDAKKDALEAIAKRKLVNKEREQWSGYIEIDPEQSGSVQSEARYTQIGDIVHTLPPENGDKEGSTCSSNIKDELYYVVGVQHSLNESGNWGMRLDVVPILDGPLSPSEIETKIRYYDPSEKEYIEENPYRLSRVGLSWLDYAL
jgi:hypothetical protein